MAYQRKKTKKIPANNLANVRIRRYMTQEDLVQAVRAKQSRIRLTASTISKIERGEVEPRGITMMVLADTLEIDVDVLFPGRLKVEEDESIVAA